MLTMASLEFGTVTLFTVIPEVLDPNCAVIPGTKVSPVSVTSSVSPCVPVLGLRASDAGPTLNALVSMNEDCPLVTITLSDCVGAFNAMETFAMASLAVTTVKEFTAIPEVLDPNCTVMPGTKVSPVSVTSSVSPCVPTEGLKVNDAGLTVNAWASVNEDCPLVTVTLTDFWGAFKAIVTLAIASVVL